MATFQVAFKALPLIIFLSVGLLILAVVGWVTVHILGMPTYWASVVLAFYDSYLSARVREVMTIVNHFTMVYYIAVASVYWMGAVIVAYSCRLLFFAYHQFWGAN